MKSVYETQLHEFVNEYFTSKGSQIEIIDENFFNVLRKDGIVERYTYNARIASENTSVKLIAKGSRALVEIINECQNKGSYSKAQISYTHESVQNSFKTKNCCSLCPFTIVCQDKSACCEFCNYYKICNTSILNASFKELGTIVESEAKQIIAFIFNVEMSNDYLLGQNLQKNIAVLLDIKSGNVLEEIIASSLDQLDIKPFDDISDLSFEGYSSLQKAAIDELENKLDPQMEIFKQQIEVPLVDKVSSIVNKYYDEYTDGFTKTPASELEKMQREALTYCKREIGGYSVNCEYKLDSVFLIKTSLDRRNLVFLNDITKNIVHIDSELFLNKVNINCDHCGKEIDKSYICNNGHVICSSCTDLCIDCGKVVCPVCDEDAYYCSTCGELICEKCVIKCDSCDNSVCSQHIYECHQCGNKNCIDCYDICQTCEKDLCHEHSHKCSECGSSLCNEHSISCSTCQKNYCSDHIETCSVCGDYICENDCYNSKTSGKNLCTKHTAYCDQCGDIIGTDEALQCKVCGKNLCPTHAMSCTACGDIMCFEHAKICPSCEDSYCECSTFSTCKLCGQDYCPSCVDEKGLCETCKGLKETSLEHDALNQITDIVPNLSEYKKIYISSTSTFKIVLVEKTFGAYLYVIDKDHNVLLKKGLSFIDKLKFKLFRR